VDLLQSLNSVVQSGHHLHLVVLPLLARTGAGAPGVHHLFAAERNS
jgi:hypothetical protein